MRTRYLLCLGLVAGTALADVTVYRSVDADGTVSFSDRPPPDAAAQQLQVDAGSPSPSPEVAERREAMRALTDQLQTERLEREHERAVAASAMAEQQPIPDYDYYDESESVPLYYPYRTYRDRPEWRPPMRPLPPPQIPRPNPDSASPRGLTEKIRQQY